jgi:hypothetical protein
MASLPNVLYCVMPSPKILDSPCPRGFRAAAWPQPTRSLEEAVPTGESVGTRRSWGEGMMGQVRQASCLSQRSLNQGAAAARSEARVGDSVRAAGLRGSFWSIMAAL